MSSRPLALVVLALVLLSSLGGAVAGVDAVAASTAENDTAENDSAPAADDGAEDEPDPRDPEAHTDDEPDDPGDDLEDVDDGEYRLDDLRTGGQQIPNADPSMRWLDKAGSVWVEYPSADPLAPEPEDWEVQNVLAPGAVVERDQLTINAQRPRDAGRDEYTLVVVHYGVETISTENNTERVAVEQSVQTHDLVFDGAFDREQISLPNTEDESREVTMWLEDSSGDRVDGATWRFEHRSSPMSINAGIGTYGDLLWWVAKNVLAVPMLGIPLSIVGANQILKKTGTGPMIPGIVYGVGALVASFVTLAAAWYYFSAIVTRLPLVLGFGLVAMAFVTFLEKGSNDVLRALFIREELMDAKSPSGEDVHDVLYQEIRDQRLVRTDEDGTFVLVESGPLAFLARLFGVAPTIDVSALKTQITLEGDKWDRLFVADPTCDEVLEYQAPKLRFPLTVDRETDGVVDELARVRWGVFAWAGLAGGLGWMLGNALVGLPGLGATLFAVLGAAIRAGTVEDGDVDFVGAPVHATQARQTLAAAQSEYVDAKTIEQMEEIAWTERSRTAIDARRVMSHMDSTVTEEMLADELGLEDVEDSSDSEPETEQRENQQNRQSRGESNETAMVPIDDD